MLFRKTYYLSVGEVVLDGVNYYSERKGYHYKVVCSFTEEYSEALSCVLEAVCALMATGPKPSTISRSLLAIGRQYGLYHDKIHEGKEVGFVFRMGTDFVALTLLHFALPKPSPRLFGQKAFPFAKVA